MLRLSIIVNMFNTAKFMPRCMETLLEQDIPQQEYEIILVDDCSPDNSLEMAKEYAAQYKNVRVCTHEKNKGLAAARNTGIDAAKGEYLCFVDPDDYIEKNSLAALLKQMDEEQLDMLRFNYQKVDEQYNKVPEFEVESNFDYSPQVMTGIEFVATRLTTACYVWAYIYRLDFVRKTGIRFFEGCFFDDAPWLPRILQKALRVNTTPIRHQYYMQRTGSMVHSHNKQTVMRKVDTQMQLIDILSEQKKDSYPEAYPWYDMMLSYTSVSLLTSVAICDYWLSIKYYNQLLRKGMFPLSSIKVSRKSSRKIRLLNICPRCTLLLINMISRYRK